MADSAMNLGGLASGIDTNSIVDKLMALEAKPATRIKGRQRETQSLQETLRDVRTRLANLESAAADLRSPGLWADRQTVDVGDPSRLSAKRVSGAGPGGYDVIVSRLATSERRTYDYTPQSGASSIDFGGGVTVALGDSATLADVVSAINSSSAAPAYAADVGGRLVLSSRKTGAANGFNAAAAGLVEDGSQHVAGVDAQLTVDGSPRTSPTNTVTNAIPGVELTLKGLGSTSVIVSPPSADLEAIKGKVKAFVDQYNSTLAFVRGKLTEKRERAADGGLSKGFLAGDTMLQATVGRLREALTANYGGSVATLAAIGVAGAAPTGGAAVDPDAVAGKLVLDDVKLANALTSDREGVRRLLGAAPGTDGVVQALGALVAPLTRSGGQVDNRLASADASRKALTDQLDRLDKRLEQKQSLLKRQFAAMEQAMQSSQSQGQWLSGQLAALQRNNN